MTCDFNGINLESGNTYYLDSCTTCNCEEGQLNCITIDCQQPDCNQDEYVGTLPGHCCQSCQPKFIVDPYPHCEHEGVYIHPAEPCSRCSCFHGEISCMDFSGECMLPDNCESVQAIEGICCPVCMNITSCAVITEGLHDEGDTWSENCSMCTCEAGTINCLQQTCPELNCTYNEVSGFLPGDCCPSCLPRLIIEPPPQPPPCQQEGLFTDPVNPCLTCYCHDGHTACLDSFNACDQLPTNCKQVEFITGQCCPICQDETVEEITITAPVTCTLDGQMLADGESMPQGLCSTCTCIHGQLACDQQRCPDIKCPFSLVPVFSPDQCCPSSCSPPPSSVTTEKTQTDDFVENVSEVEVPSVKQEELDSLETLIEDILDENPSREGRVETR